MKVHQRPEQYSVKFTHADLNASNILVEGGHITGIIDWEFAGWYPEYWDYTKMWWSERRPLLDNFYQSITEAPNIIQYEEDKAAGRAIWKHMHPGRTMTLLGPPRMIRKSRILSKIKMNNSRIQMLSSD